jgi:hypothetical protein
MNPRNLKGTMIRQELGMTGGGGGMSGLLDVNEQFTEDCRQIRIHAEELKIPSSEVEKAILKYS